MPRLWRNFYAGISAKLPADAQAQLGADSEQGLALRRQVLGMLGLADVRIAFTGSNLPAVQAAIASCFGIGILVERSVRDDLRTPGRPEEGYPPVPPASPWRQS